LSDMTQQRELERRLFRSEELAAIGELSAGIAHEIRNPLVAITTAVSLLKDESQLSDEGQQLLDIVKEESDHLAAIVEDFLQFARPKKPTFKEEDIRKFLNAVVKKYRDLDENRVKWVERYEDNLPMVSIDRHQIQQVITNLLLNGLDAMQNDGVLTIEARQEKSAGQDRVRILVSDSGVGISEDEISKIFQPFYSMKEKGTGMGLAICRRIMEEHDGEILVESKIGKGTTFSLLLPVRQKRNASQDGT
jgi:signal transduction histidine kinase